MNWDANLAAIIKHTDANLKQQFRQFEDLAVDLGASAQPSVYGSDFAAFGGARQPPPQPHPQPETSFAHAFLRDTMATMRGGNNANAAAASFAQHFRERQERKRHEQQFENSRGSVTECDGASDGEDAVHDHQQAQHQQSNRHHRRAIHPSTSNANGGIGYQMYASPTYDVAQMMEQVRLSLKLEVDARAAIAERQLSALLQLCKSSSEELDRLRVEVYAADRQLHTLDQVQSKMRQELTTQKDIGFHLQSMCGKDESWRMQAENQLLELRQMVAAIREQGNSIQMQVQEKLSRQELLVQFNAAIEPIKAQFQATLQHQAHQLAEITRSSSSSSLLLDALTQKVNRVQSEEIVALRNDLQALKIHVSRMGIMTGGGGDVDGDDDGEKGEGLQRRQLHRLTQRREKDTAQERERLDVEREQKLKQREEALKKQMVEVVLPQAVLPMLKTEIERSLKSHIAEWKEWKDSVSREVGPLRQDVLSVSRSIQENWTASQRQVASLTTTVESHLKQLETQLRGEVATQIGELRDKQDRHGTQTVTQLTVLLDSKVTAIHNKHNDMVTVMEGEQKERKAALGALQEDLRKSRHALEEQLHILNCEHRTKTSILSDEWSQKLREVERKWNEIIDVTSKQNAQVVQGAVAKFRTEADGRLESVEARTRMVEDVSTRLERSVEKLTIDAAAAAASLASSKKVDDVQEEEVDYPKPTRRVSVTASTMSGETQSQLASIDSLLQKMMLQMQLQLQQQQQQQLVMAQSSTANVVPAMYPSPYWSTASLPSIQQLPTPISSAPIAPVVAESSPVVGPSISIPCASPAQAAPSTSSLACQSPSAQTSQLGNNGKPVSPVIQTLHPPLDDIISRAVAEELASSPKPRLAVQTPAPPRERVKAMGTSDDGIMPTTVHRDAKEDTTEEGQSIVKTSDAVDAAARVQQTLVSTAKGAITEAEMAKLRIEARRKQEQESRQQGTASTTASPPPPPSLVRSASTSSIVPNENPAMMPSGKLSPALTRSNSVSNIQVPPQMPFSGATQAPPRPSPAPPVATPVAPTNAAPPPPPSLGSAASSTAAPATPLPTPLAPRPTSTPNAPSGPPTSLPPSAVSVSQIVAKPSPPPTTPSTTVAAPTPKPAPLPTTAAPPQPQVTHVLCDQCRLPVRSDLLTEHMLRQCIKRTVACSKCQFKFPWHEVEVHQRDCQRSTLPSTASIPSSVPPPPLHNATAPIPATAASPATSPPSDSANSATAEAGTQVKKCRYCIADVVATELFEHELKCDQMLKQCPHCLRRQKVAELQDHIENCDCRLVTCPNDCGGKFLQRGIDKHLATRCPKRAVVAGSGSPQKSSNTAGPAVAPPPPPSLPSATLSSLSTTPTGTRAASPPVLAAATRARDEAEKVECKFCDEEFAAREIDAHENNCDWKPKRCQHCNMVIISRDLARHESSCKTSSKNCPHCNETMAQSALPAHTSRCSKRPIKCIRCCQLFPADSIVTHSSNCKFIPSSSSMSSPSSTMPSPTLITSGYAPGTAPAGVKIPPPPPYPPSFTTNASVTKPGTSSSVQPAGLCARPTTPGQASAPPTSMGSTKPPTAPSTVVGEETVSDRLARRNLALSQLTNQPIATGAGVAPQQTQLASNGSAPTMARPQTPSYSHPEVEDDDHDIDDDDEEEGEEEDDDDHDDDDDDQLTLAQVVAEWSVENVCLWLHEDVGVPEVVPRFQQRRCTGEMLLELTESDLINDYGIKNRVHRERILSAIDAIKTSDDFSDDEEEDEDEDDDDEEDEDEDGEVEHRATANAQTLQPPQQRASMSRLTLSDVSSPRDLLRRNTLPTPQQSPVRFVGTPPSVPTTLPSSSAMLRRINSALNVEFPPSSTRIHHLDTLAPFVGKSQQLNQRDYRRTTMCALEGQLASAQLLDDVFAL